MDTNKTEETTHTDPTEPIISWSGVQGETQVETANVEVPNQEEVVPPADSDQSETKASSA